MSAVGPLRSPGRSMKPVIFVSAVSRELRSTRQLVANTLHALGYEPIWQDMFGTEGGDLRKMLREKVDRSAAVLQIVGDAYGAEPRHSDPVFGRVSYTQYEALYAKHRRKRVYYLVTRAEMPRDEPSADIDAPRDASAEGAADARERQSLQGEYRAAISRNGDLYYTVGSPAEVEVAVRRLRDDLHRLRRRSTQAATAAAVLLTMTAGGGIWLAIEQLHQPKRVAEEIERKSPEIAKEIAKSQADPEVIRDQLRRIFDETFQRQRDEADSLPDWRDREKAVAAAEQRRNDRVASIDAFLFSISDRVETGDASREFIEMNRVLEEQGVDQAIAYVTARQDRLFRAAESARATRGSARRDLAPVVEKGELLVGKGDYDGAVTTIDPVLQLEPNWPEAMKVGFDSHYDRGQQLDERGRRSLQDFDTAVKWAQRRFELVGDYGAECDLATALSRLGDVTLDGGDVAGARRLLERSLAIAERIGSDHPDDTRADHARSLALGMLGQVASIERDAAEARNYLERSLEIAERLAKASSDDRGLRDLAISLGDLGWVLFDQGDTEEARPLLARELEIAEALCRKSPKDPAARRYLAIALADSASVSLNDGDYPEAGRLFGRSLEVAERLIAEDPDDVATPWHQSFAIRGLADVAAGRGDFAAARRYDEQALTNVERILATDPDNVLMKQELVSSLIVVGARCLAENDYAAARGYFERGHGLAEQVAKQAPERISVQIDIAMALSYLGDLAAAEGDSAEALRRYQASLELAETVVRDDTSAAARERLALALNRIAPFEQDEGRKREAYERNLVIYKRLVDEQPTNPSLREDLAISHANLATALQIIDRAEAADHQRTAIEILERLGTEGKLRPELREWIEDLRRFLAALESPTNDTIPVPPVAVPPAGEIPKPIAAPI